MGSDFVPTFADDIASIVCTRGLKIEDGVPRGDVLEMPM